MLSADEVLVPASSFIESDICNKVVSELGELFQWGLLRLVASAPTLADFAEEKLAQYPKSSLQYQRYVTLPDELDLLPAMSRKQGSSTADIASGWTSELDGDLPARLLAGTDSVLPPDFERRWEAVPNRLGRHAFIVDHVSPLLAFGPSPSTVWNRIHDVINRYYFDSYTRELAAGIVVDLVFLDYPLRIPVYGPCLPYKTLWLEARSMGLDRRIESGSVADLLALRSEPSWQLCLASAVAKYDRRSERLLEAGMRPAAAYEVEVVVITALPDEYAAAVQVFHADEPCVFRGRGAGRSYALGTIRSPDGRVSRVAVTLMADTGNNNSVWIAAQAVNHFPRLKFVVMSGIAGGVPNPDRPDEHVRLGDVVVCDRMGVVQYDFDREWADRVDIRNPPRPPAAELLEADRYLRADRPGTDRRWAELADDAISRLGDDWRRPPDDSDILRDSPREASGVQHPMDPQRRSGFPRFLSGPIASGNKVLRNPLKRDQLRDRFGVKAVEMEGSGIADATWNAAIGYIVVRGVCDYCNPDKGDQWHKYAAVAAAAYSRVLLERVTRS